MLSKIRIKNFKSIEDLTLDMAFSEGKAPNGYQSSDILPFISQTAKTSDRVVPVMNIYGANASGKSNIIKAILCCITVLKHGLNALKRMPIDVFSINKLSNLGDHTFIQIDFFLDKKKYHYTLAYNSNYIVEETLCKNDELLFSIHDGKGDFNKIAIKGYSHQNINKKFTVTCLSTYQDKSIQTNPFLSSITTDLPGLNKSLSSASRYLKDQILVGLDNHINSQRAIDILAESSDTQDKEKALARIEKVIKKLDIDIEHVKYESISDSLDKFKGKDGYYHIPRHLHNKPIEINKNDNLIAFSEITTVHKNKSGEYIDFGLNEESAGTQLSFGIIGAVLRALDSGSVLIIDELDRSLHSLLLKALMRVFKDKEYNTKNAQLICILHNTDILEDNIYKVSEFSFVNKNLQKGTFITRLSDIAGVRNDVNFRDRYLDGLYSGIPYPLH